MDRRDLFRTFADRLNLNDEAPTRLPLVELIGNNRVLIENHRGVREFGKNKITVCAKSGLICVCGKALELRKMSESMLVISGRIEQLLLLEGEEI